MVIRTTLKKDNLETDYYLIELLKELYKNDIDELINIHLKNDGTKFLLLSLIQFGYNHNYFYLDFKENKKTFSVKLTIFFKFQDW